MLPCAPWSTTGGSASPARAAPSAPSWHGRLPNYGPAHLTLIDNAEYNLYRIDLELAEAHPTIPRGAVLCDVRDPDSLACTFGHVRPELVFHAAALKHVPMVEANPDEGVLTNAVGTRNVADACIAIGARAMVLVSTDKSVDPSSVMGATKRIAEGYCQALAHSSAAGDLRLVTVRFGNVIGSSGSVVPLFQRQIAAGGPVTVTDPDVARYFMTAREAVQLLLQASALGAAEEGGGILRARHGQAHQDRRSRAADDPPRRADAR